MNIYIHIYRYVCVVHPIYSYTCECNYIYIYIRMYLFIIFRARVRWRLNLWPNRRPSTSTCSKARSEPLKLCVRTTPADLCMYIYLVHPIYSYAYVYVTIYKKIRVYLYVLCFEQGLKAALRADAALGEKFRYNIYIYVWGGGGGGVYI